MSTEEFDLSSFLPYRLSVLASRVSEAFARDYGSRFGITIPEWRVLAHLSQFDRVSVREIHARVDMDKSKVSRAAARLEAAGLVAKAESDSDRRLVALSLTPKGRRLFEEIVPLAREIEASVARALGADRAGPFADDVETLIEAFPKR